MALLCTRADVGSTLEALLPGDDSPLGRDLTFFAQQRAAQVLALEAVAATDGADAAGCLRDLRPRLESLGLRPLGGQDEARFAALANLLEADLPALIPVSAWDTVATRISPDGLDAHLAALRERTRDPGDVVTAAAARDDLLGLTGFVLEPLRDQLGSAAASQGLIVHEDGAHVLLLAEVPFAPGDADRTHDLMEALDAEVARAAATGVRLEVIGSHRHFRDNLDGIRSDLLASLPVGMAAIALILFSLVRSLRALAALHVPALLAALGAVAVLVAFGQSVPVLLIGFAAGFLGVSIENALHMTTALQQGQAAAVRRPLIVSYLTTAVAFAVLLFSGIPALRSLGLMVMAGLVLALVASLHLLPALVRQRAGTAPWPRATAILLRCTRLPLAARLIALGLLSLICLPGLARLDVVHDLRALDGSRPETTAALDDFLTRWDRFETSDFLVAQADDLDTALAHFANARERIDAPPTLVDLLLPSRAVQEERWAAWNRFWTDHAEGFAAALRQRLGDRGFAATEPSRRRYQPRPLPDAHLTLADWTPTPFGDLLDQTVTTTATGVTVAAPLGDARDPARVAAAAAILAEDLHARIASRGRIASDLVALVKSDLARLSLWMALAMVVLVAVLERHPRRVIAILVPPVLALAWAFGILGWLGVPLTPFSVMVAAFVAGIGLDNAVFLARPQHREAALAPVLACTVTTIVGVGSLIIAENPILRQNGIGLSVGLACCLVCCLLLTPVLMPEASSDVRKPSDVRRPTSDVPT